MRSVWKLSAWTGHSQWLHQGYDADEVDVLLDDAADSLERVSLWALVVGRRQHAIAAVTNTASAR